MPEYALDAAFARSREAFAQIEGWLDGPEAGGWSTRCWRSSCRPGAGKCCGCCCRITRTCGRLVTLAAGIRLRKTSA